MRFVRLRLIYFLPLLSAGVSFACSDGDTTLSSQNPISPNSLGTTASNTNTNTNNNTITVTIHIPPITGSPAPTTPPGAPPTPVTRTPDPPAGQVLSLPAYTQAAIQEVAAANPTLIAQSCVTQFGESGWRYLDLVVDRLRARDTRFGYVCSVSGCTGANGVSPDTVSYHATAGPETTGAQGIYILDIIESYCTATPSAGYLNFGFSPDRAWTNRGRF